MAQYLSFAIIGLAFGCLYAAIGMGVVVTYRGAGVINFATGAIAMWGAYVYAELREKGDLVLPVAVIPHRISLGDQVGFLPSFALGVLTCAVLGLLAHVLVFRPLRAAPVLAKVVASVGILLFFRHSLRCSSARRRGSSAPSSAGRPSTSAVQSSRVTESGSRCAPSVSPSCWPHTSDGLGTVLPRARLPRTNVPPPSRATRRSCLRGVPGSLRASWPVVSASWCHR